MARFASAAAIENTDRLAAPDPGEFRRASAGRHGQQATSQQMTSRPQQGLANSAYLVETSTRYLVAASTRYE